MQLLKLDNVSLEFLDKVIFNKINFVFNKGDKIGIIGDNGTGKTSLFNIIFKKIEFNGNVEINNQNYGYLSQDDSFEELSLSISRKKEIEKLLLNEDIIADIEQYNSLLEEYNALINDNIFEIENQLIKGFNFRKELYFKEQKEKLSGGETTKLRLIRLFSKEHDFYLLDEPTNHLDSSSKDFLVQKLIEIESFILISHDVELLNKVCNRIVEIKKSNINSYSGNYDVFLSERQKENDNVLKIQEIHNKKKKKIENEINKQENRVKGSQNKARSILAKSGGILKSDDREMYHVNKSKMQKFEDIKNKIVKKRTEELNNLNTPELDNISSIKIKYFNFQEPNNTVLQIDNLNINLDNFKLYIDKIEVEKKDKVAILGDNGSGKSTLLNTICGLNTKYSGKIILGSKVKIGYLGQKNKDFNFENSLLDEIKEVNTNLDESDLRKYLGKFLFRKNDAFKKIKDLSGGERIRFGLLKVILQGANFLILDEPSNHLDIKSKDILAEALKDFLGSIMVVSHDKYFIDKFVNKKIYLENGRVTKSEF
ncbi:MAG: ribosomal protection-like ABC-F family protein [bacterium]